MADRVRDNLTAVSELFDHDRADRPTTAPPSAAALLDSAEEQALGHATNTTSDPHPESDRLSAALRGLRGIDQAVLTLAHDLGATTPTPPGDSPATQASRR